MKLPKYLNIKNYLAYCRYLWNRRYKRSYAQTGEDLIIDSALKMSGIVTPSYLDIGTYHPIYSNNTYLFYRRGSRGVCIEPNPEMFRIIKKKRKNDLCLNVGISSTTNDSANYYVMTSKFLNTFNKEGADEAVANDKLKTRQKIEQVIKIPLVTVNSILEKYLPNGVDILSVDAEGYDISILTSLDFNRFHPKVICVETLRYDADGTLQKNSEINEFLTGQGYSLYADTCVNSIFLKSGWERSIR